jgi:two-component system CheB/CheR fusion protein
MDGFEVASIIRQTPEAANVDLIAITGYAEPEMMVRSRAAGFRKHLIKPVSAGELLEVFSKTDY